MKTCKTVVMLFAVAVLVLNGVAQAQLIDQDFDNTVTFVPGSTLNTTGVGNSSTSVGLWTSSNTTPGSSVDNTVYNSAGQSLKTGRSAGYDTGRFIGSWEGQGGISSGVLEFTFSAKKSSTAHTSEIVMGTTGAGAIVPLEGYHGPFAVGFTLSSDDNLYINVDEVSTQVATGVGTGWHDYKIVLDIDNVRYDAYYDDMVTAVYTGAHFNRDFLEISGDVVHVNAVSCLAPYTDGTYAYVDDITVIPEPATMMLIGLGGLLGLRRRRK